MFRVIASGLGGALLEAPSRLGRAWPDRFFSVVLDKYYLSDACSFCMIWALTERQSSNRRRSSPQPSTGSFPAANRLGHIDRLQDRTLILAEGNSPSPWAGTIDAQNLNTSQCLEKPTTWASKTQSLSLIGIADKLTQVILNPYQCPPISASKASKTHFLSMSWTAAKLAHRKLNFYQCHRAPAWRTAEYSGFLNVLGRLQSRTAITPLREEWRSQPA